MVARLRNEAEIRQAYLDAIKDLANRSKEFLRTRGWSSEVKASCDPEFSPAQGSGRPQHHRGEPLIQASQEPQSDWAMDCDLTIYVDGTGIYRQNLATGRIKVLRYTLELAEKLWSAVAQPTAFAGEVAVVCDRQSLYVNDNGRVRVDALHLSGDLESLPHQEPTRIPEARADLDAVAPGRTLARAQKNARATRDIANAHLLRPMPQKATNKISWAVVLLLLASVLGTAFALHHASESRLQAERQVVEARRAAAEAARLREEEARQAVAALRREEAARQAAALAAETASVGAAVSLVEDLYYQLSAKQFDKAMTFYGPQLEKAFSPRFFSQFRGVTVENLRSTSRAGDSLHLMGENTYIYPDGSTQREVRSYAVSAVDGELKIVSSEFIRVIKPRY